MICPVCGGKITVFDSRSSKHEIIRKRKCVACKKVFYTSEKQIDEETGKQMINKIYQFYY